MADDKEHTRALRTAWRLYMRGRHKEAFAGFEELAQRGVPVAQYCTGQKYWRGEGVEENDYQALEWFRRAANGGHLESQYLLSPSLAYQTQNAPTEVEALEWLHKAAVQGHPRAQYDLGVYYATGCHLPKDEAEGLRWYLKAAAQGHAEAQYNAGLMYLLGEGTMRNTDEAKRLLEASARKGFEDARKILDSPSLWTSG